MDRTRKRDGRTDGRTDGLTDGRTVRLLYASQSSFGGIKNLQGQLENPTSGPLLYQPRLKNPCLYSQDSALQISIYFERLSL